MTQRSRSANYSIRGYLYQFDKTVLELLRLKNANDSVVIEGIEDLDILGSPTNPIQCKYHSDGVFSDSGIRDAIVSLISSYKSAPTFKYTLYTYYQSSQVDQNYFTLQKLKSILTLKKRDGSVIRYHDQLGMDDEGLERFLQNFSYRPGIEFEAQRKEIYQTIKTNFNCDSITAESHLYPNAFNFVATKASESIELNRKISKKLFKSAIDTRRTLFNSLLREYEGSTSHKQRLRKLFKSRKSLSTTKAKFLLIANAKDTDPKRLAGHLRTLIDDYFLPNKSFYNAKPWTIILDHDDNAQRQIKKHLLNFKIAFNDGYEEIDFSPHYFDKPPFISRAVVAKKLGDKISDASYRVRIISLRTFLSNKTKISEPDVIFIVGDGVEPGLNEIESYYLRLDDFTEVTEVLSL